MTPGFGSVLVGAIAGGFLTAGLIVPIMRRHCRQRLVACREAWRFRLKICRRA